MGFIKSSLLATALFVPTLPVLAEWVEAQGEAIIIDGNVQRARSEAIEQAISYASLQSGMAADSANNRAEGGLNAENPQLYQQMMTGPVQIISEKIENHRLKVQLRVEVMDTLESDCSASQLKAAILIPTTSISDRSQLSLGQLHDLGGVISTVLAKRMDQRSATGFANLKANMRLNLNANDLTSPEFRLPDYLANQTDSQYVLVPRITDLSSEPGPREMLGLVEGLPERQFGINLTLFHGISGEILWQQSYHGSAPWEFKRNESIAPGSDRFWRSAYGRSIDKLLAQAGKDLDNALMCRPVLAQIVAKQGASLVLNMGRRHGIRVGDELAVVLAHNLPDRRNQARTLGNNTKTNIKITQISEYSAHAELTGLGAIDNIQVSDFAVKIPQNKN